MIFSTKKMDSKSQYSYKRLINSNTAPSSCCIDQDVVSKKKDIDPDVQKFLEACEQGELQGVRKLVESKAVDPTDGVVDERRLNYLWIDSTGWYTNGWTPLHYASV